MVKIKFDVEKVRVRFRSSAKTRQYVLEFKTKNFHIVLIGKLIYKLSWQRWCLPYLSAHRQGLPGNVQRIGMGAAIDPHVLHIPGTLLKMTVTVQMLRE